MTLSAENDPLFYTLDRRLIETDHVDFVHEDSKDDIFNSHIIS